MARSLLHAAAKVFREHKCTEHLENDSFENAVDDMFPETVDTDDYDVAKALVHLQVLQPDRDDHETSRNQQHPLTQNGAMGHLAVSVYNSEQEVDRAEALLKAVIADMEF